jgi:nucleotide-binding universal stress UspA family protein
MGRVLVGIDGSAPSQRALEHAMRRVLTTGDELVLATIIPSSLKQSTLGNLMPAGLELPHAMSRTFQENAQLRLDELVTHLTKAGARVRSEVRMGEAPTEILRLADETEASEIFIGHKAFEGPHLMLGKNAEGILRNAKVPVTVVP